MSDERQREVDRRIKDVFFPSDTSAAQAEFLTGLRENLIAGSAWGDAVHNAVLSTGKNHHGFRPVRRLAAKITIELHGESKGQAGIQFSVDPNGVFGDAIVKEAGDEARAAGYQRLRDAAIQAIDELVDTFAS